MRNWMVLLIAIISCSFVHAHDSEDMGILTSKAILEDASGYFVLSDGSCWKVMAFSKRWRSLSEWWSGVQLVPENYECVPNDWILGTEISIFSKYGNLEVSLADAVNQDDLKQCTHLLLNERTGQVLFAMALHPGECMIRIFEDAHKEGYKKGKSDGYYEGYTVGYNDGYDAR